MGVKDGAELGRSIEPSRQRRRHSHIFMGKNHRRVLHAAASDGQQGINGRFRQPHVLLIIPDKFIAIGFNAELFKQMKLKHANAGLIKMIYIDQQNFRVRCYAREFIMKDLATIN